MSRSSPPFPPARISIPEGRFPGFDTPSFCRRRLPRATSAAYPVRIASGFGSTDMPLPVRISSYTSMSPPRLLAACSGSRLSLPGWRPAPDLGLQRNCRLLQTQLPRFHHRAGLLRPWNTILPGAHLLGRAKPSCFNQPTGRTDEVCSLNRTEPLGRDSEQFIMHWDPGSSITLEWYRMRKELGGSADSMSIKVDEGLNPFVRHKE